MIIFIKTWLDEEGWERIKNRLPKRFKWRTQAAKRKNRKRRASGDMLLRIREGMIIEEEMYEEEEGRMNCVIRIGEERWRIVGVYVNGDMERKLERLGKWMTEREEEFRTLMEETLTREREKKEDG